MSELGVELVEVEEPAHWWNFDFNATGSMAFNFSVILYGWSVKNVSSTTLASFDIYDATAATGPVVFPINLAANETNREFWNRGVLFRNGLYVNVTAQEVKGALFYRRHHG